MRLPLRSKVWILLALASALPLIGSALVGLPILEMRLEQRALGQLALKAHAVAREIQRQIDRAREDVLLLSRLPQVRAFLTGTGDSGLSRTELESALMLFSASKSVYNRARVLDVTGRELVRVDRRSGVSSSVQPGDLQSMRYRDLAEASRTLPDGAVHVSRLGWEMDGGKLIRPLRASMRYCTGVFGQGPDCRGLAVLNLDGESLLAALDPSGLPEATVLLFDDRGQLLAERGPRGELMVHDAAMAALSAAVAEQKPIGIDEAGMRARMADDAVLLDVLLGPTTEVKRPGGWIRIRMPAEAVFAPVEELVRGGGVALALLLIVSLGAGSWISRQVTRPLLALTEDSRRLSEGDCDLKADVRTGDEIEDLALALGHAARELGKQREMEQKLLRAEKLAAVGQFAAEVAHEVGNPLAAMKTTLQAIQEDGPRGSAGDARLERVVGEIDRLAGILRGVRQTAQSRQPLLAPCDPSLAIGEVAAALASHASLRRVLVRKVLPAGCPAVQADGQHLRQILFNLLLNAIDATPAGETVTLEAEPSGELMRLSVSDSGPGVVSVDLEKIFEPFFTTKADGTGLGLWVTGRLVRDNGGTLKVESLPGRGARFTVELPLAKGGVV